MSSLVKTCFIRWYAELKKLSTITQRSVRWDTDFGSEITNPDIYYSIFLIVLSLISASFVVSFSKIPQWIIFAQLFGTPLQIIISGFLMSALFFAGTHLNRNPKTFSVAFGLMLRIMSLEPFLRFFFFFRWGSVVELLIFGVLTVIAATKTYAISLRNAFLFWGIIYFIFAVLQIQSLHFLVY